MGTLSDITNVQIALNTAGVQRATFGIPLIASPLASFAERVRSYNRYDSTNPDNLPPALMTALSDAFAQIPRPKQVKVGRLSILKAVIEPTEAVNLAVYSLKIDGTLVSITSDASATKTEICTALATAIDTAALGVDATAVGETVEVVFTGAVKAITAFTKLQWGTITPSATVGIVGTDLGAINDEDGAWYVLHMTERDATRVLAAAEWVETQEKIFITASADANIADVAPASDTTTIAALLKSGQYYRTGDCYHATAATEYADVAWASRVLTIQPGGETWALKRLASVTPDKLTQTQRNNIFGKNANTFEWYQSSLALTNNGKVAAGEWLDVIRFRDYLKDLIQTNMVQMMINRDKVPYTDQGIQLIVNNLRGSLRTGQQVGGIAPDEVDADGNVIPGFIITAPLRSEIDDVTAASRVLTLTFSARIAGAIHVVDINGSLVYSLD